MAYLTCNESFQGLKDRLKSFKGRLGQSSAFSKLKASLKDPKVRRALALGGGYLALGKLYHNKQTDAFDKKAKIKVAQGKWTKNGNSSTYTEKIQNFDADGNAIANSTTTITHTAPSYTDVLLNPLLNRYNFKDNIRNESAMLIPGTFVNEGIIDTVKEKVSGAVDSVGNFFDSAKKRVQTNVGNIANGINSVTNKIKGVASGIADGVSNVGKGVSNFASNIVGSKNVKPANESYGFRIKPVRVYESINERFNFFPRKKVPKGRRIVGALGALGGVRTF